MLSSVRHWVLHNRMLQPGDQVLVAVSGGPDSVALLDVMRALASDLSLQLHVFHMDHGLRGEASAEDARYVHQLAVEWGLPSTIVGLGPEVLHRQSGSLQANARAVRYAEIKRLADRLKFTKVATGHNWNDQAETVLMRLLRGSGPRGLAGIPPTRVEDGTTYIRPLLNTSRAEIETYCREHNLHPRVDASNAKPNYLRNRIRLELIPHLAHTYNPGIVTALAQVATVLRAEDAFVEGHAHVAFERCRLPEPGVRLDIGRLLQEPIALARRVVRLAAHEVLQQEFDLGLPAVSAILEAMKRSNGSSSLDLPGGLHVELIYGICRFSRLEQTVPKQHAGAEWDLPLTGETVINEVGLRIVTRVGGEPPQGNHATFDLDRLPGPLSVRFRRPGDRIWPTGMVGSKKLQDILVDAKVPRRTRDQVPLLTAGDSVLWVIGHRVDRRYAATADAVATLHVQIENVESQTERWSEARSD